MLLMLQAPGAMVPSGPNIDIWAKTNNTVRASSEGPSAEVAIAPGADGPDYLLPLYTLDDFQRLGELEHPESQGTYETAEFLARAVTSRGWLSGFRRYYEAKHDQEARSEQDRREALQELGGVLHLVAGFASNAGVNVNEAVDRTLHGDGPLSPRAGSLAIVELDNIVGTNLDSLQGLAEPFDAPGLDANVRSRRRTYEFRNLSLPGTEVLAQAAQCQYGHGGMNTSLEFFYEAARHEIAPLVGHQVLRIGLLAHQLGSSLAEIVELNVEERLSTTPAAVTPEMPAVAATVRSDVLAGVAT